MAERENVIDFTVPYYDLVGITILMKKPKAKTQLFKSLCMFVRPPSVITLKFYIIISMEKTTP